MSYVIKDPRTNKYWGKDGCYTSLLKDAYRYPSKQDATGNLSDTQYVVKLVPKKKTYANTGAQIGTLVEEKQLQYGDSHGKAGAVLNILYPDGIKPEQFASALTVTRVIDKLFRIATDNDPGGESPWTDVAGYSLLQIGRT